jgi:hypothetical protein
MPTAQSFLAGTQAILVERIPKQAHALFSAKFTQLEGLLLVAKMTESAPMTLFP